MLISTTIRKYHDRIVISKLYADCNGQQTILRLEKTYEYIS